MQVRRTNHADTILPAPADTRIRYADNALWNRINRVLLSTMKGFTVGFAVGGVYGVATLGLGLSETEAQMRAAQREFGSNWMVAGRHIAERERQLDAHAANALGWSMIAGGVMGAVNGIISEIRR